MAQTNVAERAVRQYLQFLEDPDLLVDRQLVEKLQARVDGATDPVDRLLALAEFERARHPMEDGYRKAFVQYAKAWADNNQVPASAFERLGVPWEVLMDAGIEAAKPIARSGKGGKSVTTEAVKAVALGLPDAFTAADVVAAAGGGSPMTVRKGLAELVESGKLLKLGSAPDWTSPGRAPTLYRRP